MKERHGLEEALFVAATEGMKLAAQRGIEASGYAALSMAYDVRVIRRQRSTSSLYNIPTVPQSLEINDYFRKLGNYVELASELDSPVDPQG